MVESVHLFYWVVGSLLVLLVLISFIILLSTTYIRRIKSELEAKNSLIIYHQKELVSNSVQILERERERIASDLHDDLIGQLHRIQLMNNDEKLNKLLASSIDRARNISHDLSPPMLNDSALLDLITDFISPLKSVYEVCIFYNTIDEFALTKDQKLHVFRTFQELVSNIIKHAKASKITILYRHTSTHLCFLMRDDGKGINKINTNGLGMKNIELRMQMLEASYRFKTNRPKGTTFIFTINKKCYDERKNKNLLSRR